MADIFNFKVRQVPDFPDVEVFSGVMEGTGAIRHLHESYSFGISENGAWATRYRGQDLTVTPGQVQIAQPGEISICDFDASSRRCMRVISLSSNRMLKFTSEFCDMEQAAPDFPDHLAPSPEAANAFHAAHRLLMSDQSALESATIVQNIVLTVIRRFAADRFITLPRYSAPRSAERAREFIEDRLSENITLTELSAVSGLSSFHLCRVFKRHFGLPPHAYQNHRRIERAKSLLAQGLPAKEVAPLLGFSDQSHLIRQFKMQTGVTPLRYQQCLAT